MKTELLCTLIASFQLLALNAFAQPLLNEVYLNPPGNTLSNEFIEIKGPPLGALDGYYLAVINGNPGLAGRADMVMNLNGMLLGTNGLLVVRANASGSFTLPPETRVVLDPRLIDTVISPLNNDSVSVLLLQAATTAVEGTDYDTDNDGIFDVAPLNTATIADAIAIRRNVTDPVYGGVRIANVGNDNRPEAVVRLFGNNTPNDVNAWFGARMNGSGLTVAFSAQVTTNFPAGATLTPGRENEVLVLVKLMQSGSTTDLDEDGTLDSYTVALGAAPTGSVVIAISADAQVQVSLDGVNFVAQTNLTFTTNDFATPQSVTVRAVDDTLPEAGYRHPGVIAHQITSTGDTNTFPTNLVILSITANIFDNDSVFSIVQPTQESPAAFDPADSDDPAFWIHPTDASSSFLIVTKKLGGATVFDFNFNVLQEISPGTNGALRFNNVDVLYGFPLNGTNTDLAVCSDRISDTLYIFRIDPNATTNPLVLVSANLTNHIFPGSIAGGSTAYGLCLYQSPLDGHHYAFVSRDSLSEIAQLKLVDAGSGLVAWQRTRTILLPDPRQVEGMVADRELGWLYLAQEKVGLWKFPAEPSRASDGGSLLQRVKPLGTVLAADVEGLCIYYGTNGTGYLLASSQGDNTFAVFARGGTNTYLSSFAVGKNSGLGIDQVTTCDGSDVMPLALPGFPNGVLVVHDGENDGSVSVKNTNFKLVPWADIAGSILTPLQISPSAFEPRVPVNRLPARFDAITRIGGELRVTVSGPTGLTIAVQSTADFVVWNTVTNIAMTVPVLSFTNNPTAPQQFYRLIP